MSSLSEKSQTLKVIMSYMPVCCKWSLWIILSLVVILAIGTGLFFVYAKVWYVISLALYSATYNFSNGCKKDVIWCSNPLACYNYDSCVAATLGWYLLITLILILVIAIIIGIIWSIVIMIKMCMTINNEIKEYEREKLINSEYDISHIKPSTEETHYDTML